MIGAYSQHGEQSATGRDRAGPQSGRRMQDDSGGALENGRIRHRERLSAAQDLSFHLGNDTATMRPSALKDDFMAQSGRRSLDERRTMRTISREVLGGVCGRTSGGQGFDCRFLTATLDGGVGLDALASAFMRLLRPNSCPSLCRRTTVACRFGALSLNGRSGAPGHRPCRCREGDARAVVATCGKG